MAIDSPGKLYKYCSYETGLDILSNKHLRWHSPSKFNDGLELNDTTPLGFDRDSVLNTAIKHAILLIFGREHPKGDTALVSAISRWRDNKRFSDVQEAQAVLRELLTKMVDHRMELVNELQEKWIAHVKKVRISCFADKPDNLIAWQKFGHNFGGLSLRFAMGSDCSFGSPRRIEYINIRPEITSLKEQLSALFYDTQVVRDTEFDEKHLIKPPPFKFEREWRCIKSSNNAITPDTAEDWAEYFSFEPNELTALYLGCYMSDKQKHTLSIIAKNNFKSVSIYQIGFAKGKYDLIIEPYPG